MTSRARNAGSKIAANEGRPERPQQDRREAREQQQQRGREIRQERGREIQRQRPQQEQARRVEPARQQPHRTQQQAAAWQQQRGWVRQGGWQAHESWQQHRARSWASDHRTWVQRGGYGGHFIPAERFRVHFGREHWFRIHSRPVMYMGYPRFSYAGFSFMLVDPWPEYWAESWYDSDDVYIDYDDGYYLYNRRHPGIALAITVVL